MNMAKYTYLFKSMVASQPAWHSLFPGFVLVLLLLPLAACSQPPSGESPLPAENIPFEISTEPVSPHLDPASIPSGKPGACPKLDSMLNQLVQSSDSLAEAERLGLAIKEGKIQVLFNLVDEDSSFLMDLGVELGSQSGNQVQGFAAIESLCELSKHPSVQIIQLPARAIFP